MGNTLQTLFRSHSLFRMPVSEGMRKRQSDKARGANLRNKKNGGLLSSCLLCFPEHSGSEGTEPSCGLTPGPIKGMWKKPQTHGQPWTPHQEGCHVGHLVSEERGSGSGFWGVCACLCVHVRACLCGHMCMHVHASVLACLCKHMHVSACL